MNYQSVARQAASRYGLDPNVFARQIQQESGYNPNARSPAGAVGIAQFMPGTARGLGINPLDPVQALNAAAKLMAGYVKQYGGYRNALVAYNAGPGTVGKPLPAETQNYVKTILGGTQPKMGKAVAPTYGAAPNAANGANDARRQIALSLIGFGGLGSYGSDPLTSALLQANQSQIQRQPQQQQSHATGVVQFDNKPVASWIVPILKQARSTGLWKGSVTSGERTKPEQLKAARNFGLQNYGAGGPLASNHVYGNSGAVDVSDPAGLKRALAKLGINGLRSAMPNDISHFSKTGY